MRAEKRKKTILIIMLIWFAVFITDVICSLTLGRPIFVVGFTGGEVTKCVGLGYTVTFYYGMTPSGIVSYEPPEFNLIVYICANIVVLVVCFMKKGGKKDADIPPK
jgi:hypothetical protein